MPKLIDRFLRQIDQASSFLFCIYLMDLRVPARTRQNALLGVAWTDPFEICQDHKCLVASLRRETNCSTRAQDSPGPPAICGETSSRPDAPSQLEYSQDSANRLRGSGKNTNCCLVRTSKNSRGWLSRESTQHTAVVDCLERAYVDPPCSIGLP